MSYINETCSSLADFVSKLNTFLSGTPGWTTHHNAGAGEFAARKSGSGYDVGFAAQWSTAAPNNLGIYHFLGAYNNGVAPYQQADDSGNGAQSTTDSVLDDMRFVAIGNTPVQYWCFEDDHYFHVVVQVDATRFVHFGAGQILKYGSADFTGGEYVYGHRQEGTFAADTAIKGGTSILLDGLCRDGDAPNSMEEYAATLHIEGMDSQVASGKFGVVMGAQNAANLGNDRQAVPKARVHIVGGFRGGPGVPCFGQMAGTLASGLMPGYPLVLYYRRTSGSPLGIRPLGVMKDVRGVSIKNFAAGQEVTVGADTWTFFPSFRKSPDDNTVNGYSAYQGIAYKKVTT